MLVPTRCLRLAKPEPGKSLDSFTLLALLSCCLILSCPAHIFCPVLFTFGLQAELGSRLTELSVCDLALRHLVRPTELTELAEV